MPQIQVAKHPCARSCYPTRARAFAEWVSRQVETHNARTTTERERIADQLGRDDRSDGSTSNKVFLIAAEVIDEAQEAMDADLATGRAIGRSAYIVEAVRDAIEREREANGGSLPPAPKRLPNGF